MRTSEEMENGVAFISGGLPQFQSHPFDPMHAAGTIYRSIASISPYDQIKQAGAKRLQWILTYR